jgi:hypothetical protein
MNASLYNVALQLCLLCFNRFQQSDYRVFMLFVAFQQHLPLEVDDSALSCCFQSAHESFKVVLALLIVKQHAISYSDCNDTSSKSRDQASNTFSHEQILVNKTLLRFM